MASKYSRRPRRTSGPTRDMPDAEIMKPVVDRLKFMKWLASFGSISSGYVAFFTHVVTHGIFKGLGGAGKVLDPLLEVDDRRRLPASSRSPRS